MQPTPPVPKTSTLGVLLGVPSTMASTTLTEKKRKDAGR
jgi:hypothetical protein